MTLQSNTPPIYRPEDRSIEADHSRRKAVRGGVSTGYTNLDEYMTIKQGFPLVRSGRTSSRQNAVREATVG